MLRVIIFLVFVISAFSNAQADEWVLKKENNGIKVYTRKTDSSPFKEFRATTVVNTDLKTLIEFFENVEGHVKWMADCKISKTLEQLNDSVRYDYVEVDVPWPFENRDMIMMNKTKFDNNHYIAELTSTPEYIDKKDGIIRLEKGFGKWEFLVKNENEVIVSYQFLSDPGVVMPGWIIDMFIVDGPYKTLSNLKEFLK